MMTSNANSPTAGPSLRSLGVPGFSYADLHDLNRLGDLLRAFEDALRAEDPGLAGRYLAWREAGGRGLPEAEESDLIVAVAGRLAAFLARLFGVEEAREALLRTAAGEESLFRFRRDFLQRRALRRKPEAGSYSSLDARVRAFRGAAFAGLPWESDEELATSRMVCELLDLESAASGLSDPKRARPLSAAESARLGEIRAAAGEIAGGEDDLALLRGVLGLLERWAASRRSDPRGREEVRRWASWKVPEPVDFQALVRIERPDPDLPGKIEGPWETRRRREGFHLTDPRFNSREVLGETHYCILCHRQGKDSCLRGFSEAPGAHSIHGEFRRNPLGIPLTGCPLDERISEMHVHRRRGDSIAALAIICIDNPLVPGTGHRICNDCMKGCIYQKQDPVNIPQVETGVLTDVLRMPWGFEIWSLLTRWNPLNPARPVALPYNGRNVLVVGMGPAGYTLAHFLLNEGFGVAGIDGLKIEPLPEEWIGDGTRPPRPIRDYSEIEERLDERVLLGFGGVSEYGITVRWDKNFLKVIYLSLLRRSKFRVYGGVRFGGTLEIDDAWALGFDHIAIATGAGKPTLVRMKNNLIRGIRKASDFLMALQLTGAAKASSMANLQVRLPAVVIGGGLTGIDTATELTAYYPRQVEKVLRQFEAVARDIGEEAALARYDAEERGILETFLEHGRAVRAERERASAAGERPDLARLVRAWGGVTIYYRKSMLDSPAYRLNHEEIIKALEEGIFFVERMDPVEAVPDAHGALSEIVFEEQEREGGRWRGTGRARRVPARALFVAAGTHPNIIYERERPGTFRLDGSGEFFQPHRAVPGEAGGFRLEPAAMVPGTPPGFFTSYEKDGRFVTFYGDNHPVYEGNVVKAMASARDGFHQVREVFEAGLRALRPEDQPAREDHWRRLRAEWDDLLLARVERVERLTPTIVEVVVRAPLAARKFHPGQFYRLQNFETLAPRVAGSTLATEGLALTGAWTDRERGLLSTIVLEMGVSSRLCAYLRPGERVILMGPTGAPTEIPRGETVLLTGGGLGNAVLFSIARALKENGCRVLYFAGYKDPRDVFKREEIEAATDQIVWASDVPPAIPARRPQDKSFVGNIVMAMRAYGTGELGEPRIPFSEVDRILAIGSDRMMAAVKEARHKVLADLLRPDHEAIGSINSIMQCMMKEICAQCLQRHVDPKTGQEKFVFSCFNQDQPLDLVDFGNLNARLRTNSVLEKTANLHFDHLLRIAPDLKPTC